MVIDILSAVVTLMTEDKMRAEEKAGREERKRDEELRKHIQEDKTGDKPPRTIMVLMIVGKYAASPPNQHVYLFTHLPKLLWLRVWNLVT